MSASPASRTWVQLPSPPLLLCEQKCHAVISQGAVVSRLPNSVTRRLRSRRSLATRQPTDKSCRTSRCYASPAPDRQILGHDSACPSRSEDLRQLPPPRTSCSRRFQQFSTVT